MRLIVADTGPLNYLVLIREIELIPKLFEKVVAPMAVIGELLHDDAPGQVRRWATQPPIWLEVRTVSSGLHEAAWQALDVGEREALALARALQADLILMDDRAAVTAARQAGFAVTGTLGVLDLAARQRLVDISAAIERLKTTSFRYRPEIFDQLLAQHRKDS
jgi:predicted nucleic acid-binding protein